MNTSANINLKRYSLSKDNKDWSVVFPLTYGYVLPVIRSDASATPNNDAYQGLELHSRCRTREKADILTMVGVEDEQVWS